MEDYILLNQILPKQYNSNEEIDWIEIAIFQNLSEEFIECYRDKLDWNLISKYQTLSETLDKE